MPFPWKKVKSARISQLVNDHLHKQRDGSSLVVETGFPTSLIDLFIKNREKLKKPSKRKRRNHPISSSDDVSNPAIEESPTSFHSPPPPPPPPPPSLVGSPAPNRPSSVLASPPSCVSEICVSAKGGAIDDVDETKSVNEKSGDINVVLVGVLKIFVVLVLALATKRLTAGITISAVLLLLLEYAAKTAAQIGKRLLTFKKLEQKTSAPRVADQETEGMKSNDSIDEIQPEKESSRERLGFEEIELLEMAMKREEECMRDAAEDPKKKSRKARIKSKVQKMVSKKFRRSRKDQEGLILSEEKVGISSEDDKICLDHSLSDVIKEEDDNAKGESEVAVARTYMPLCLIVLSGLIGGRVFALVLTLSCFLLLKLGQKLPTRIKLGR